MSWVFWALCSAVFAAVTAVLAKVGVEKVPSNLATAIRTSVILVFAWAVVIASRQAASWPGVSRRALLFLVLSGVTTGLSWLCYFRALQLGPASKVAPLDKLSLPLVILLAALFLGERLGWREAAGVAIIFAGTMLLIWP